MDRRLRLHARPRDARGRAECARRAEPHATSAWTRASPSTAAYTCDPCGTRRGTPWSRPSAQPNAACTTNNAFSERCAQEQAMQVRQHWWHVTARSVSGGSAGGADARRVPSRARGSTERAVQVLLARHASELRASTRVLTRRYDVPRRWSAHARRRRTRAGPATSTLRTQRRRPHTTRRRHASWCAGHQHSS
jgi:hypothetical protein